MPTWTIKGGGKAAGNDLSWDTPVTANTEFLTNPDLTAGMTATGWTYASASTGTADMPATHTIQDDDLIDVYWADGIRHGMTAAVTDNSVALSSGSGDDLPPSDTTVLLCVQVALSVAFVGNSLAAVVAAATIRSLVCLVEGDGTANDFELVPTGGLSWAETQALTNPLKDKTIVSGTMSTTDPTSSTKPITFGILYDATPLYPG